MATLTHPLDSVSMSGTPSSKGYAIAWIQTSEDGEATGFGYILDGLKTTADVNKGILAAANAVVTLNLLPGFHSMTAKTLDDDTVMLDLHFKNGVVRLQSRYIIATGTYREIARSLNNG
jgi:hypothetical protein